MAVETPEVFESPNRIKTSVLVVTELVRWAVIVLVIYLNVWQYCVVAGYTIFVPDSSVGVPAQFWGVFTGIMVGVSVCFYLPWRLLALKLRLKYNLLRDERWSVATIELYK